MFDVRFESQSNLNEVIDVTGRKTKIDSTPAGKRFKNHLKENETLRKKAMEAFRSSLS